MTLELKKAWRCPNCRTKERSTDSNKCTKSRSDSAKRHHEQDADVRSIVATSTAQLKHLEPLSRNVEKMSSKIDALQEANSSSQELFERSDSRITALEKTN